LTPGVTVEEVTNHEILRLLGRANNFHNRLELIALTQLYLEMTGNAFWLMNFDGFGLPEEIYLLPTQWITPERDHNGMVIGWKFGQGQEEIIYPTDDVIHFKTDNLADPYGMGSGPVSAAWNRVQIQVKELGFLDANLTNFGSI
jgi:phage portal protein BeeE